MRIIAVIDDPAVIRRILKHLRLWQPTSEQPHYPARDPPWPADTTIPLTCHPFPVNPPDLPPPQRKPLSRIPRDR